MSKYKTYLDEDGDEQEFTVFIIHGHSEEWRKIERFIKDELKFNAIVLKESFNGKIILDNFKKAIWDKCECAVAIISPDEKLINGSNRTRQNVFYEIGYCQGVFESYYTDEYDFEPVTILKEKTIDFKDTSDLLGLQVIEYSNDSIESTFHFLGKALKNIYKEFRDD